MAIGSNLSSAALESVATFLDFPRWAALGWTDIKLRYRRTVLGPWWATISIGAMIGSVGLVFGNIFSREMSEYMPFFATGIILWTFISSALIEGCGVFSQAGGLIKSIPAPLIMHVYRMLWRLLVVLAHHAVLILLLWAWYRWEIGWSFFLVIPGMLLLVLWLVGTSLVLGILCTRFRDIQQVIASLLQLLFLLTPIVWTPQTLTGGIRTGLLLNLNPLYHIIEAVRGPILGHPPELKIWAGAALSTACLLAVGLWLYARFRFRVPYWL